MTKETMELRIEELELLKENMRVLSAEKRLELATKEAEANEIKKIINENQFAGTEEEKELQELKITLKWLKR